MTPREVAWGVSLSVQDGRIVIHAPAGNVAPALQKRNKLAPPTKRNVAGIDAEAGEGAATGPMFEAVED